MTDVWNHIGVDIVGPLPETARGNKYIVTATDYFSKWPEAAPLPDKTALGVANFLFSLFCRHGWPKYLSSDQGREFVNGVVKCLFELTKVEHHISSAYHPQTNGLDERTNQTLVTSLIKLSSSQTDWDMNIDAVLYAYRISQQDSSKFSPFFLLYNRHPRKAIDYELSRTPTDEDSDEVDHIPPPPPQATDTVIDKLLEIKQLYHSKAKTNIEKAQARQKKYYDAKYNSHHVSLITCWFYIHI